MPDAFNRMMSSLTFEQLRNIQDLQKKECEANRTKLGLVSHPLSKQEVARSKANSNKILESMNERLE